VLPSLKDPSFQEAIEHKMIHPRDIESLVDLLRKESKTIATLNGSFDLLHAGHIEIIYQASLQADYLIVALNTDRSIREYKSPSRPIIPLNYRMQMMAALFMVDYVTFFDETTPISLLQRVRPDVHVNGVEYGENCIEAATVNSYGGRIHIVDLIPGLSTSQIIQKIVVTEG